MITKIDRERTVAVTGHRTVKSDFDILKLENTLTELILKGYNNFLIGMAVGFDTLCFRELYKLKERFNITITAVIPCLGQDKLWNRAQQEEYKDELEKADKIILLTKEYSAEAMLRRNRYLVDNSNVLVAYITRTSGGSYYTVKYAAEKAREIIYV